MKPGEEKYPHIFSPGRIGKVEFKNRIKYASTETNFNYGDGYVAEREIAYMEAQARGGAGIVTTQGAYTDPLGEGKGYVGMMGIWDDKYIPGLKRIADVIREHDSVSVLQLMHCGRVGGVELDYTVGPSVVPQRIPRFREPREMTVEDIQLNIRQHVDGALRCQEAGFDMVEISGIVGYLLSNFVSSYTNQRTDQYGGSVENRARFVCEIVSGIRKAVGPDYPIIIRLCGDELLHDRGGNTVEQSLQVIKLVEAAGIDCLSVTAGWQESAVSVISRDCPQGSWLYIAEKMKRELSCSIAMAYRLFEPQYPEAAIAAGHLDVWESCRAMIADPELPNKILAGKEHEVRPCMACNICLARLFRDAELSCMVRPSLGRERDPRYGFYGFPRAHKPRKIAIIGAGIAGMQAGAIAAEKGHDVTIYDKLPHTGGQSEAASHGPWGDEEFMRLVRWLELQCRNHGVSFELGQEITAAMLEGLQADEVIVATGAEPQAPDVPIDGAMQVVSCLDVMRGKVEVGKRVAILGGKGVGISTALALLDRGDHQVALIHDAKKIGLDVNPSYIWRYKSKLKQAGAATATMAEVLEITATGVRIKNKVMKDESFIECDTVVLADMAPVANLVGVRKGHSTIGDALLVRRGNSAILDGFRMGMRL